MRLKRWARLVRGWFRLNVCDICPHCANHDAESCPICSDLVIGLWTPNWERQYLWARFRRVLERGKP